MSNTYQTIKSVNNCQEWRDFKKRWDKNIPKKGCAMYKEYQRDADQVNKSISAYLTN